VESEDGFRGKGFEADQFKGLEIHGVKGWGRAWFGGEVSLECPFRADNKKH
jgi:hypothetical protein